MPFRIREFPVLVEQAKTMEQLEIGSSGGGKQQKTTQRSDHRRNLIADRRLPPGGYSVITAAGST